MISTDDTLLDLLEQYPETEDVFKLYTQKIGICICCEALFCTVAEVAERYELDIEELMTRLNNAVNENQEESLDENCNPCFRR